MNHISSPLIIVHRMSHLQIFQQWIFYFNYEAPSCENPTVNPTPNSLNGAVKLANANTQRFRLPVAPL